VSLYYDAWFYQATADAGALVDEIAGFSIDDPDEHEDELNEVCGELLGLTDGLRDLVDRLDAISYAAAAAQEVTS
jgi:hypothetical protein